jgi:hypothetical protein
MSSCGLLGTLYSFRIKWPLPWRRRQYVRFVTIQHLAIRLQYDVLCSWKQYLGEYTFFGPRIDMPWKFLATAIRRSAVCTYVTFCVASSEVSVNIRTTLGVRDNGGSSACYFCECISYCSRYTVQIWTYTHAIATSSTWTYAHAKATSGTWTYAHVIATSCTWTYAHATATSGTWTYAHAIATSCTWTYAHATATSVSELTLML